METNNMKNNFINKPIRVDCDMPLLYRIIYFVLMGILGLLSFIIPLALVRLNLISSLSSFFAFIALSGIVFLIFRLHLHLIRKCYAIVYNDHIEGKNKALLSHKDYYYSIDKITNVEVLSFCGVNKLVLGVDNRTKGLYLSSFYRPGLLTMKGNRVIIKHIVNPLYIKEKFMNMMDRTDSDDSDDNNDMSGGISLTKEEVNIVKPTELELPRDDREK